MRLKYIFKAIRSQLRLNILLTLLLTITFTITSTALLLFVGVNDIHDQSVKDINGPQLTVYYDHFQMSDEEAIDYFSDSDDIERSEVVDFGIIKSIEDVPGEIERMTFGKVVYDPNKIDYKIQTSKDSTTLSDNEVYLPLYLKNYYDLDDIIVVNGDYELNVVGFYEDPYLGSSFEVSKAFLMNESTFNNVESDASVMAIYLYFEDEVTNETIMEIEKQYQNPSFYMFASNAQFKILSMMLPIMFSTLLGAIALCLITVIMLVISHTIKSFIYSNYKQYGIMISIGFTRNDIIISSILKTIILNTIAFILGITITYFILPIIGEYILYNSGMMWNDYFGKEVIIAIYIISSLLLSFISYLALKRIRKISVIRALASKGPDYSFRSRLNLDMTRLHKLPINISFSAKKLLSNIRNYISLAVLTVALTILLVNVGSIFAVVNTDDFVYDTLGLPSSDLYLVTSDNSNYPDELIQEIDKKFEVKEYYTTYIVPLGVEGVNIAGIVHSDFEKVNNSSLIQGRYPTKSNEIVLTALISDKFDVELSDVVNVTVGSVDEKYVVVGIVQSVAQAGNTVMIKDSDSFPDASMITYNITFEDGVVIDDALNYINEEYEKEFSASKDSSLSIGDSSIITNIFFVISLVAYAVTILFISLISYLLAKMSIIKEQKDIGILKAIGFSNKQVRIQFITRFMFLTIICIFIGLIIGRLYGINLVTPIFSAVGIAKLEEVQDNYIYVIPLVIIILVNFISTFLATRSIRSIEIKTLINE